MSEIAKAYVQIEPTFNGVQSKIEKEMGAAGQSGGNSFGSGFAKVLGGAGSVVAGAAKVTAGAVTAGAVAVAGLTKSATESLGEYEQLVGGVETLFGDAAGRVQTNAAKAFASAGMSANEYMETSIQSAAALINSLEGDTSKAADLMDMSITDMSDNVNKMGTSMEAVSNAYRGFSRGNFTMLDNLALGFSGTKEGMQQLLDQAQSISGIKYDISSYSDIVEAIHVVQTEMGITGTTAKEASSTIQGSLSSLSAAWQNVVTGMGDQNADMGALINTLVENAQTFISNLLPVIEQTLQSVSTLIAELAPVIAQEIPGLLQNILPMLLSSGVQIIQTLADGLLTAIPQLMPTITEVIINLATMLIEMLPQLIEVGAQVILELAMGIAQALPTLMPTIVEVILSIVDTLTNNIDMLVTCAIALMEGLTLGLINALPILIEKAPEIIIKLTLALMEAAPKLIQASIEMVKQIAEALITYWPILIAKIPTLLSRLAEGFTQFIGKLMDIGKEIVDGIRQGIENAWDSFIQWFGEKVANFVGAVKDFFKIGSPSKLMADEIGYWIPAGVAGGIEDGMGVLDKAVKSMTSEILDDSLTASVSGAMTMQADVSDSAIQALLSLLEQYLPIIASGENLQVILEGDVGRLFRALQRQAIKNTQLVGTDAVLSAT